MSLEEALRLAREIAGALGHLPGAWAALCEAVEHAAATGSKRLYIATLDCTASLAVLKGQPAVGARFYGASELAHERSGAQREPADARFHEPLRRRAEEALGAEAFSAACAAGRELPLEATFAESIPWVRSGGREPEKRRAPRVQAFASTS